MRRLRVGAPLALLLAVSLTACAPALPDTVVPGTGIALGWTGEFTSANAAASPTPGNVAVAETIRSGFGDVVDGEFVADASFGAVTIVGEDPFIVRYDLAEPAWSDGIPLDAADLLLGWAAASGSFEPLAEADAGDAESVSELPVPAVDEFARAIDVTFAQPVIGWQRAVTVPVPAHVVGRRAFGIDDAMEAKQAVIRAIQTDDRLRAEMRSTPICCSPAARSSSTRCAMRRTDRLWPSCRIRLSAVPRPPGSPGSTLFREETPPSQTSAPGWMS
jgi:peptide/nickel transport system substrate-binding protein